MVWSLLCPQMTYVLLDIAVQELFPELKLNEVGLSSEAFIVKQEVAAAHL